MKNKYYGYIEGYYGRTFSWTERFALLDHLHKNSFNTYLYAPKEDRYHRIAWREPYPAAWIKQFSQFVAYGQKRDVRVVPAIAPGLSFDYCSEKDYKTLLTKIRQILSCGSRDLALLMDDISEDLPKNCEKKFRSLGQAHGALLTRLNTDLNPKKTTLWFCPTIYTNQFIKEENRISRYLLDLADILPATIPVFWTGPRIVSKTITDTDLAPIAELFKNNLVIWDNFYANDYCPGKLFLGSFTGRSRKAIDRISGLMLNPTGLFCTDCLYLDLMAGFLRGKNADQVWRKTLLDNTVPEDFFKVARFFGFPMELPKNDRVNKKSGAGYFRIFEQLIWHWKGPLQCEWYEFLSVMANDIKLVTTPDWSSIRSWIIKKYPPLLAETLLALKK